ncbi:MAG: RnfABCDGE type electron transport complex subunit G [Kiritimatiellaceae bacterium]|nr:RnfABCDGE type electron transport complex subunit G [Kiritimatiellaceae bacterium]
MSNGSVKLAPLVISMSLISCIAATLMAWAYIVTKAPIAAAQQKKTNEALGQVLPEFDNQPAEESVQSGNVTFYKARKNGLLVGFVGETISYTGYSGPITVLAGLNLDGTITTVLVTKQTETPGLGTVVCGRVREKTLSKLLSGKKETGLPPNRILDQFSGMSVKAGDAPWTVKKDGGTLDAISGATITSRAVGDAVFMIAEAFTQQRDTLVQEIKP